MNGEEQTKCLNVDLDIWSKAPLDPLVDAFGKKMFVLYVGKEGRRYGAHLEISGSGYRADADRLIRRFVAMIKALPRPARKLWNSAQSREFNIGVQGALSPRAFELRLQPETLDAAASVNGRIVVTVYAAELPQPKAMRTRTARVRRSAVGRPTRRCSCRNAAGWWGKEVFIEPRFGS